MSVKADCVAVLSLEVTERVNNSWLKSRAWKLVDSNWVTEQSGDTLIACRWFQACSSGYRCAYAMETQQGVVPGLSQRKENMKYVYVLDPEGKPLMPTCRYGKVRRMLRSGQARAVSTLPFTIRLTYKPQTQICQPVVVGFDPGRTNIGLAAVREDGTCLYRAHCTTRNKEIVNLMRELKKYCY